MADAMEARGTQIRPVRRRQAIRRPNWTRRLLPVAGLAIAGWTAACWAPATAGLAPGAVANTSAASLAALPAEADSTAVPATAVPTSPAAPILPAVPTLTVAPTPAATLVPAPVPPGAAAVVGLRADYAAIWLKNHAPTKLRAGPGDQEPLFSELPQWTTLKQLEVRGDWTLVYYGGDGASRVAGPGWVRTADTGRIGTPTPWLQTAQVATLWSSERSDATTRVVLPRGVRLETMGVDGIVGERVHVRTPGDGRSVAPAEGWIDAGATASIGSLTASQVPWAFPAVLNADLLLTVPYRTQIDGTDFASANCGPTALGMVLERYGIDVTPKTLRGQVLEAQENDPDDDDAGSFIWSLDNVARSYGLKTFGLYEPDGSTLRHWSADDVRDELRHNNPVVVQVRYRYLPRRQESEYYGDHYVVITGLMGDSFLYNDPIWGPGENEGPGWDRLMTAADLTRAMNASDGKYAYAAFAVGR